MRNPELIWQNQEDFGEFGVVPEGLRSQFGGFLLHGAEGAQWGLAERTVAAAEPPGPERNGAKRSGAEVRAAPPPRPFAEPAPAARPERSKTETRQTGGETPEGPRRTRQNPPDSAKSA